MTPITFQGQDVYELRDGDFHAAIAPQAGARLLYWSKGDEQIVRWPLDSKDADWSLPAKIRGGNPLLFPFIARHMVDGEIGKWKDADGVVRDLAMHGFARDSAFTVVEEKSGPNKICMRLTDSEETLKGYPFQFEFDVTYELKGDRLTCVFETTNTGEEGSQPMPYHVGHHYYFNIPHDQRSEWKVTLPCKQWGWQNEDGSIRHEDPTESEFLISDDQLLDRFQIGLEDISDEEPNLVKMVHEPSGKTIKFLLKEEGSLPWFEVTTWTMNPEADYYCVEPWLGLPDAIHHKEGIRKLPAGQSETAICTLKAENYS